MVDEDLASESTVLLKYFLVTTHCAKTSISFFKFHHTAATQSWMRFARAAIYIGIYLKNNGKINLINLEKFAQLIQIHLILFKKSSAL
jgi:hypothetical protein